MCVGGGGGGGVCVCVGGWYRQPYNPSASVTVKLYMHAELAL